MGFNFQILGFDAVMKKLEILPAQLHEAIKKSVGKGMLEIQKNIVRKVSGERLRRRTGRLATSIQILAPIIGQKEIKGVVKVGGENPRGPSVSYARIQEEGGTITPKRAKYLTIPTEYSQTAGGDTRFSAREVISNPNEFGYDGTVFLGSTLFGYQGKRNQTKLTPLFNLVKSVTIKPKWFVRDSVSESKQKVMDIFNSEIKNRLKTMGIKA